MGFTYARGMHVLVQASGRGGRVARGGGRGCGLRVTERRSGQPTPCRAACPTPTSCEQGLLLYGMLVIQSISGQWPPSINRTQALNAYPPWA